MKENSWLTTPTREREERTRSGQRGDRHNHRGMRKKGKVAVGRIVSERKRECRKWRKLGYRGLQKPDMMESERMNEDKKNLQRQTVNKGHRWDIWGDRKVWNVYFQIYLCKKNTGVGGTLSLIITGWRAVEKLQTS